MKHVLTFLGILATTVVGIGQNTIGLLSYQPSKAFDGYNLIFPHNQPNVYLLDNCGEIVNSWTDAVDIRPGNEVELLADGRIVIAKRPDGSVTDPIWAGGGGATIEIRDWDNNVEWSYTLNTAERRLHHGFAVKPNGNLLLLAWEKMSREEAIQAGRDSTLLPQDQVWPDYIFEIDPKTDSIWWEWHAKDHLIQDFDPTKDNLGIVAEHPELIDFNFDTSDGHPDWMHSNAIDYHPDQQQILLCVPTFNEVWVIDQSTTTEQAADHFGGLGGRGGDLMFRWGNPMTYDAGGEADQQLFFPHSAHWILDVDPFDSNFGKIGIYNNQVGPNYSYAQILANTFDMYSWGFPMTQGVFDPAGFDKTIKHPVDSTLMYSTGLSSIQYLPNKNYLILVGRTGYAFELTPDNEVVWEYRVPIKNGQPAPQGTALVPNNNTTFQMTRYPADFPGFAGKDLSGKGWIELNPDTTFCSLILPVRPIADNLKLSVYPNPANETVTLEWEGISTLEIEVLDLAGRIVLPTKSLSGGKENLDISALAAGMYIARVNGGGVWKFVVSRW